MMLKFLRRVWSYLTAAGDKKFDERADPRIQLDQAITEAQDQHQRLKEQAASVIANQKQTELRLARASDEQEKLTARAQQAVKMASQAESAGDAEKVARYTNAAEALANRLIGVETEVEDLKQLALQSAQASDQAKRAVEQNGRTMQQRLSERQKLLSQLDQAQMSEQLNTAMASLNESVGDDTPTFDEVRNKIEARYAKASGVAELEGSSVDAHMREIEEATINSEAQARLATIREQLDMGVAPKAIADSDDDGPPS